MNTAGPVLRDIHLPPAAWWPPAPGWWAVAVLLVLLAVAIAWWLRRRARRRPLAVVLREIEALATTFAGDGDVAGLVEGSSRLMRRVARCIDPVAATRSGAAWRAFVREHARDATTQTALDGLLDARFRAHPMLDVPALLAALRLWCRDALRWGGTTRRLQLRTRTTKGPADTQAAPT